MKTMMIVLAATLTLGFSGTASAYCYGSVLDPSYQNCVEAERRAQEADRRAQEIERRQRQIEERERERERIRDSRRSLCNSTGICD